MFVQMRFGGGREWSCGFFFVYIYSGYTVTKLFLYVQALRLLILLEHVHRNVI